MKQKRVSVLGIGTELTSGQILNRNASWISGRLASQGVQTSGHWTVPDDRALIQRLLDLAAEVSDVIFITGGLGPTTDDFTREEIAKWTGLELEWHEPTWTHIRERLESRGLQVRDSQKQQCYYPRGAVVLTNSQGTAHGFRVSARSPEKTLVVLPGPPREIEAIWRDHLEAWLPTQFPELDPWITRSWDTIGIPESTVAELTEEALRGSNFEKGYRVHLPYVEVKLSYPKSRAHEAERWVQKVTEALAPITALRDGEDAVQLLAQALKPFVGARVEDMVSGSYLFNRLVPHAGSLWREGRLTLTNTRTGMELMSEHRELVLNLRESAPREAEASISWRGQKRKVLMKSPIQSALLIEREKQFFAEMAALFWVRELRALIK